MILDVAGLDPGQEYDACIIGSGPAGMTLAVALHAAGKRVLVLEAGGRAYSDRSQDIYRGEIRGEAYHGLHYARLRYLGGTSNHWAGRCRPLDAIDFEARDAVADTGWPITRADLDPYADAAKEILDLAGDFADTPRTDGIEQLAFVYSDPIVNFGDKYIDDFAGSESLSICLEANLTGLETDGERVTAATVQDYDGHTAHVRAESVILACGAIENCRLLLHFNAVSGGRLIEQADTLGRYLTVHPHTTVADAFLSDPEADPGTVALDAATKRELGLLNCHLSIRPVPQQDSRIRAIATDLACLAPAIGSWVWDRMGRNLVCSASVLATWEQVPRAENHVALSADDADMFDMPAPVVHLRGGPEDLRTVKQSLIRYGEFMARNDLGRVRMTPWLDEETAFPEGWLMGQYHQMGGTRMSRAPGAGIVDADLRVWGQDNLYVAGSSVFPSGGHTNPTFTICQLSLRLADHLTRTI